jgi:hypothetical protein
MSSGMPAAPSIEARLGPRLLSHCNSEAIATCRSVDQLLGSQHLSNVVQALKSVRPPTHMHMAIARARVGCTHAVQEGPWPGSMALGS